MLTREQLVGHRFLPFEEVKVPSMGGSIGVQGMTAGDAVAYYKIVEKQTKNGMDVEALAKLLVRCIVDEQRERIFGDDEWNEVMKWPNAALHTVAQVAMRLNNGSAEGN